MRSMRPRHSSSYSSSRRRTTPLEIGAHDLAASDALLGDQAGAFEDGDVLLNRREAHRVRLASSTTGTRTTLWLYQRCVKRVPLLQRKSARRAALRSCREV
jgi:hypothetical protein